MRLRRRPCRCFVTLTAVATISYFLIVLLNSSSEPPETKETGAHHRRDSAQLHDNWNQAIAQHQQHPAGTETAPDDSGSKTGPKTVLKTGSDAGSETRRGKVKRGSVNDSSASRAAPVPNDHDEPDTKPIVNLAVPRTGYRDEIHKIFNKVPRRFLPEHKNPCWLASDGSLACLPYFYLIGMPGCGTTDLWNKISAHPEVIKVPKEPHWWGPRRTGYTGLAAHAKEVLQVREMTGGDDDSSIDWYINWYKKFALYHIKEGPIEMEGGGQYYPKVFGDASTSTAYAIGDGWFEGGQNRDGPVYINADLIRAAQPKAKIIIMLRDPTQQARSMYFHSHEGKTTDDWHTYARKSIECYNTCRKTLSTRYCAYSFGCPYSTFQGINTGLYEVYIKDWINTFSNDEVLVLRLEDWHDDQTTVFKQVLEFLELRALTSSEEQKILKTKWTEFSQKESLPDTQKALEAFYRTHNERLAELLWDDSFLFE